jgi:hypothetical protein
MLDALHDDLEHRRAARNREERKRRRHEEHRNACPEGTGINSAPETPSKRARARTPSPRAGSSDQLPPSSTAEIVERVKATKPVCSLHSNVNVCGPAGSGAVTAVSVTEPLEPI